MAAKPKLLYISPVAPALTGNGLAMRAGMVLEALAGHYEVYLLVAHKDPPLIIPERLERLCRRASVIAPQPLWGFLPSARMWRDVRFDVVHVFRLAMLPFSKPYLGGWFRRPRRHLDLDDIESLTRRRLAALYRLNGDNARAERKESGAQRQEIAEAEAFRMFDRVYVCSSEDRRKLEGRARGEICVLPNAVRLPPSAPEPPASGPFDFLFVGTLGYYPNADAVRYLCSEIVPRIRDLAGECFAVTIVGTGASKSLREVVAAPPVRFLGEVPDLEPCYAAAHAILAPIRAGGGTRIKVLEAFSYRRPVVATTIAMEGIEAQPEEHMLIGDTPDAFARQCARLISDRELGARLARNALDLVTQDYTLDALGRRLAEMERR